MTPAHKPDVCSRVADKEPCSKVSCPGLHGDSASAAALAAAFVNACLCTVRNLDLQAMFLG